MKYVSDDSGPPTASPNNGFWIHGDTVYDVTTSTHIRFLIDHPHLFGIGIVVVGGTYRSHSEPMGAEGSVRNEVVRLAASRGWIRVRHYSKPKDYWSIQADDTQKRRNTIQQFIEWALLNKIMM